MNIKNIKVGPLKTNCYILENNSECLIIDPGDEAINIAKIITKKVVGIIITHYHFDHVGALNDLKIKYDCPVYDKTNLKEGINTISSFNFVSTKTLCVSNNVFCATKTFK